MSFERSKGVLDKALRWNDPTESLIFILDRNNAILSIILHGNPIMRYNGGYEKGVPGISACRCETRLDGNAGWEGPFIKPEKKRACHFFS